MNTTTLPPMLQRIEYPESDGKPLGETDAHRREILAIIAMLEQYFADNADIYISGNLMFYYEEGNPSAVVSPDGFVVKGVPKRVPAAPPKSAPAPPRPSWSASARGWPACVANRKSGVTSYELRVLSCNNS